MGVDGSPRPNLSQDQDLQIAARSHAPWRRPTRCPVDAVRRATREAGSHTVTAYVGIDPGQTGGIALVTHNGVLADAIPMPVADKEISGALLTQIMETYRSDINDRLVVVIEKVHSMKGQGVSSTFAFGKGYGSLHRCHPGARDLPTPGDTAEVEADVHPDRQGQGRKPSPERPSCGRRWLSTGSSSTRTESAMQH
jgi:hypothetical protein